MLLGPSFMAAFPEAPASSCAAKIPAEGGSSHGSPTASSAPGWGNVTWRRKRGVGRKEEKHVYTCTCACLYLYVVYIYIYVRECGCQAVGKASEPVLCDTCLRSAFWLRFYLGYMRMPPGSQEPLTDLPSYTAIHRIKRSNGR